jgi:hypothetical protein
VALSLPLSVTTASAADTSSTASLLNYANQMNNEEEDMAGLLHSKAGDNQALMTLSDTLKGDHKANQAAVKALADQKNATKERSKTATSSCRFIPTMPGSATSPRRFSRTAVRKISPTLVRPRFQSKRMLDNPLPGPG